MIFHNIRKPILKYPTRSITSLIFSNSKEQTKKTIIQTFHSLLVPTIFPNACINEPKRSRGSQDLVGQSR